MLFPKAHALLAKKDDKRMTQTAQKNPT